MSADPAANLLALLDRIAIALEDITPRPVFEISPGEAMTDPLCQELVWAYLLWEADEKRARALAAKVCESFVDLNEFRVCLPSELASFFGNTYPKAAERGDRMRATLNDIYNREHSVSLESLAEMNKRDARAYLDSLEGIPPYVAARTFLIGLGGHAFPLDDRLMKILAAEDALAESGDIVSASNWLERQVRSGDAAPALHALEAYADTPSSSRAPRKTTAKKAPKKASSTKPRTRKSSKS